MVSVVVPVYNAEKYLKKCVNSLLEQSYKNIEIILVNDGSTDDSLRICNEYGQLYNRIKVIDKENGGVSSARNSGVDKANGEYIVFVDSDDYADIDLIKILEENQRLHKNSFVVCDINWVDGDGTIYSQHEDNIKTGYMDLSEYYQIVLDKLFNQPYNKIYSRTILNENNIRFDENMQIGEDYFFNLEYISFCNGVELIGDKLYYYLENREGSLNHRYYEDLYSYYDKIFKKNLSLFSRFHVSDFYYDLLFENYFGSHIDCLDKEIYNKKSFSNMCSRMKKILKSENFEHALNRQKGNLDRKYYFMLKLKSPLVYLVYHKLSKMR